MTKAVNLAAFGSDVVAPTGDAPTYSCRAWVNFNGTGTVAIRASGNVSSISDLGTGRYRVNFSAAMPDTKYSVGACGDQTGIESETAGKCVSSYAFNASYVQLGCGWINNDRDFLYVTAAIFR